MIDRAVPALVPAAAKARPCVMNCGRPSCGMRVDARELCATCFIVVVEIVTHELGRFIRGEPVGVLE